MISGLNSIQHPQSRKSVAKRGVSPRMKLIGDNNPRIVHELCQMRGLSARCGAEIEHRGIRSRRQHQRGNARGERLGMDIAEEVLRQLPRQQSPGRFVYGVLTDVDRCQGYAFFLKHSDNRNRGCLEAIYAKVIGKRSSEALQKGIEIRNEFLVFREKLSHERQW